MKRVLLSTTVLSILILVGIPASSSSPIHPQESVSIHLMLGNPSDATEEETNSDNFLLIKPQFVLSYNKTKGEPNWVSWHIESKDLGTIRRKTIGNPFTSDSTLPASWRIKPSDYKFSVTGMQRGHMCPSADRNKSLASARATFVMSNMMPQIKPLNEGIWGDLEEYERKLVNEEGKEVYIVAGGAGSLRKIANGRLNVPKTTWKIILVLSEGDNDLSRINRNTRVIAVNMPNSARQIGRKKWQDFRTSVDSIEAETGFDFLSEVSAAIQAIIEAKTDDTAIVWLSRRQP